MLFCLKDLSFCNYNILVAAQRIRIGIMYKIDKCRCRLCKKKLECGLSVSGTCPERGKYAKFLSNCALIFLVQIFAHTLYLLYRLSDKYKQ